MSSKSCGADQFAQKWTRHDSTCVIEIFVVYHWAYLVFVLLEETVHKLKKAEKDDVGIDARENAERDAEEKGKADRRKKKLTGERKSVALK